MLPATFDETIVDIKAGEYLFRVKGTVPKFPGWQAAYGQVIEEKPETEKDKDEDETDSQAGVLPPLVEGDRLELKGLRPEQKFTQPPPRFTEATLVKELEENGIGRPSTYASIIGVLQDRDYANKVEGKFKPTALGLIITDLLIKSFDDILDVEYTRGPGRRSRSHRAGEGRLQGNAHDVLQEIQERPGQGRQGDAEPQGRDQDRRGVRPVRQADGDQGGEVRPVCGLQRLSRLHEHPRAREERAGRRRRRCAGRGVRNCGKPMVMKRGGSASSSRARGIPTARPRES
jgi:DNA topoisomerase-1